MRKIYLMLAILLTCAATAWADLASDITNAKTIAGLCKTKNPTQSSTAIDNAISALDAAGGGVQANYDALVEAIKAFNTDAAVKVLSFIDGLPGTATNNNTQKAYTYSGSELHFASAAQVLRFTVYDTNTHAKYPNNDSGHKFFTLSEIGITGKNTTDTTVAYKDVTPANAFCINTNASQRLLGANGQQEGYVGALIDSSTATTNYFHSQWSGTAVTEDHYLDFLVQEACTDFQFSFTSRNNSNVPSIIFVEARDYTAPVYTVSCTQEGGGLVYNNQTYTNGQTVTITNAFAERMNAAFDPTVIPFFVPAAVDDYIGICSAVSTNGTNTFYVDYYDRWHKYYIRHANKTGYNQQGYYLKQDNAGTGLDYIETANDKCYFAFEPGSEPNTLLIKAPNGKYVQAYVRDNDKITLANTKANYIIKRETADEFVIYDPDLNAVHSFLHMNGNDKVVGWNEGPGNSHWMQPEITEVEIPKPSDHPFRLTDALGNVYEGSMLVQGDTYTLPDLGVIGLTRSNEGDDNGTFTADITFPFPISDASHTNWTYIKYAYATPLFWYVQDGDVNIHTSGTNLNKQPTLGDYTLFHFAIYPQYDTTTQKFTFKVKNENKGKYLYSSANGANIEVNKDADEATLLSFQDVGNGRNNFVLPSGTYAISSDTNTGVTTLHSLAIATTNTGHLGFKAVFEAAPDFVALDAALAAAADYTIGTGVGTYTAPSEAWTTAQTEAKAAHNTWTAAQITAHTTTLTTPAPTLNMPTSGFYRFIGDSHSKRDGRNFYMCTLGTPNSALNYKDQADAYTIFYYDAESNAANNWTHNITTYEGGFNLTDDNTGGVDAAKNYAIDAAPTKGLYRIEYNGTTYLVDWGNSDIQTTTEGTNDWIGWQIEAVEELPLTIKTTGYTTFSAPVAITIPGDVTAYAVSAINESSVTLAEVSGNVAAQTGLILYKENGGDITLPIAQTGDAVSDNQLVENWKAHSFAADCGQYYLGTADGATGFYRQSAEGILAGHKAYLPAQSSAVKAFLGFDTATGLDALDALQQSDAIVYDLQGRQLPRLQKGVNIVNGKKIIVK